MSGKVKKPVSSEMCPKSATGKHTPVMRNASFEYDYEALYIDVKCTACERSGSTVVRAEDISCWEDS